MDQVDLPIDKLRLDSLGPLWAIYLLITEEVYDAELLSRHYYRIAIDTCTRAIKYYYEVVNNRRLRPTLPRVSEMFFTAYDRSFPVAVADLLCITPIPRAVLESS